MPSLPTLPGYLVSHLLASLNQAFRRLTQPPSHSLVLGTGAHLTRSKAQLIAENALLRQQLIVLHRHVQKPHFTPADRLCFVRLASRLPNWRELLVIFKPDTLLR